MSDVPIKICNHRWSTLKRWTVDGVFYMIQRCRRCETYVKREIDYAALQQAKPSLSTWKIEEKLSWPNEDDIKRCKGQ